MASLNFASGRDFLTLSGTSNGGKSRVRNNYVTAKNTKPKNATAVRKDLPLPKYEDENFTSLKYDMTKEMVYKKMTSDYIDGKKIKNQNYEKNLFSKDLHIYNKYFQYYEDEQPEFKAKRYSNLINLAKDRVRDHRMSKLQTNPILKQEKFDPGNNENDFGGNEIPMKEKKDAKRGDGKKKSVTFGGEVSNEVAAKLQQTRKEVGYVQPEEEEDENDTEPNSYPQMNPYAAKLAALAEQEMGGGEYYESESEEDGDEEELDSETVSGFLNAENMALMQEIYANFEQIKQNKNQVGGGLLEPTEYVDRKIKKGGKKGGPQGDGRGVGSLRTVMEQEKAAKFEKQRMNAMPKKKKEDATEVLRKKVEECQKNLKQIQANVKNINVDKGDDIMGLDAELHNKVNKFRIQKGVVAKSGSKQF